MIERVPSAQSHPISSMGSTYGELDPELYQAPARAEEAPVEDPLDNIGSLVQCNYCLSVLREEDADYHSCGE